MAVTHWTERTELFAEHPPLVAGKTVRFAVHLTSLADFTPLASGRPYIDFVAANGVTTRLEGSEPIRPGIFRVEGKLPGAGTYAWRLGVQTPALSDRHDLGSIRIHADETAARAATEAAGRVEPAIAYLKEQQWASDFATTPVRMHEMRVSVRVPAEVAPVAGGEVMVAAPQDGRLAPGTLPAVGARVAAGEAIARFEPRLPALEDRARLAAEVAEARAAAEAAEIERVRAERLLADQAVPARRVEEAHRALAVANARLAAAEARLQQRDETLRRGGGSAGGNVFTLSAPIAGTIAEVLATPGAGYQAGAPLFRVVRTDHVVIQAHVPPSDAAFARRVVDAALEIPGRRGLVHLNPRRIQTPGVIDERTRSLVLRIEVDNRASTLVVGEAATALLYAADRLRALAIPTSAVVTDAGRPIVFVQVAGESFARRAVELTAHEGDLVAVLGGLSAGERVVTRGAYDIRLASASRELPAEGHVH